MTKPTKLSGKIILEAGCGMGRFLDVVSRDNSTTTVGFDLSLAVDAAHRNIGSRPNVHILQADVFKPPFGRETFEFVFSIGVLHHTPNPPLAFERLVPLLKKGGEIAIWIYQKYRWPLLSDFYRIVTSRMPWNMTLAICRLLVNFHAIHRRLRYFKLLVPISMLDDSEERLLDTFDWYSPRYQFKFADREIEGWFRKQNLHAIQTGTLPVSVKGRKRYPQNR